MRKILFLLLSMIVVMAAAMAQVGRAKDEGWSELMPPDKDKELVVSSCGGCHDLKIVVEARKSRAQWDTAVNDMIQRGSQLFPEEIEPITVYLTKAFGADVPKLVNVNTAKRDELEKLPNFKPEMVTRILDARGKSEPFKNAEELRKAVGMEKEEFEKIRYLLKYRN